MQIIHVNLTQESPKLIDAGKALDMTYSVKWELTDITFAHRFDVYLDHPFFEHQVILEYDFAIIENLCNLALVNSNTIFFPDKLLSFNCVLHI